jgi:hypothetical protein
VRGLTGVRGRAAGAALVVAALSACSRPTVAPLPLVVPLQEQNVLTVRPLNVPSSPSPLMEVQVGSLRAAIPEGWRTRLLPDNVGRQGFEASPRMEDWDRGLPAASGIEAFWVDVEKLQIPSDYLYLAARSVSFHRQAHDQQCAQSRMDVVANHPPDFTGHHDSPSDFVASMRGTCVAKDGSSARWGYVVAAPGFGAARSVGIPSSGLYVVMAEVAGPHAEALLREMLSRARFGDTTMTQLVRAAGREQPN